MTGVVPGKSTMPTCAHIIDLQYAYKERTQFIGARSNRLRSLKPSWILGKELWIMLHHRGARSRGTDYRFGIALFKDANEPFRNVARFFTITGIESGLRTTCLPVVEFNLAADTSKHLDTARTNTTPQLVDEAGNE